MYNSVNDLCNYLVWLRVGVLANLGGNTLFRNPGSSKVFDIPLGGYAGNYDDNCNNYERGGVSKAKEERCTCSKRGVRQKETLYDATETYGCNLGDDSCLYLVALCNSISDYCRALKSTTDL